MAFNSLKSFGGQHYSGMAVGGTHQWSYADASLGQRAVRTSCAPLSLDVAYDSVKTRIRAAPERSGCEAGTVYHWFIVADARFERTKASEAAAAGALGAAAHAAGGASADVRDESLQLTIQGPKFKVGHKRPKWVKYSCEYSGNTPAPLKRLECINEILGAGAPPPSYGAATKSELAGVEHAVEAVAQTVREALVATGRAAPATAAWATSALRWDETKATPDRWHIGVRAVVTAADAASPGLVDAYAGSHWLLVAEQFATKLNGNQYETKLRGTQYLLGGPGASLDELDAAKARVLAALAKEMDAAIVRPVPRKPRAPKAAPLPVKTLSEFWGSSAAAAPCAITAKPDSSPCGTTRAAGLVALPSVLAAAAESRKRKRTPESADDAPALALATDDRSVASSSDAARSSSDEAQPISAAAGAVAARPHSTAPLCAHTPTPTATPTYCAVAAVTTAAEPHHPLKRVKGMDGVAARPVAGPAPPSAPPAQFPGIVYVPGALSADDADRLFRAMAALQVWQPKMWHGKQLPRMVWHYEEGVCPELDAVLSALIVAFKLPGIRGAFCNMYRDGNDHTPYHQDSYGTDVLSLSLGATRRFYFKALAGARKLGYDLAAGDVLAFNQAANKAYQHAVPKAPSVRAMRINVTVFADGAADSPPAPEAPPAYEPRAQGVE